MNPPEPVAPTDENVARLRLNLKNLQKFNDQLYTYTIEKCTNVFILLAGCTNSDPGMNVGLNILCSAMIGFGAEDGFVGVFAASFLSGLIGGYSDTRPPSLIMEYSSYISRIQATSIQADLDMANYSADPVPSWYTPISGTFTSPWGTKTETSSLSVLAAIDFPNETDPEYDQMMIQAIFAFDQTLWWSVINRNYQINGWNSGYKLPPLVPISSVPNGDAGMDKWTNNYMVQGPAHWSYWIRSYPDYIIYDYSLGSEPTSRGRDCPISNAAAIYLFIDTNPGTIVNPNGLFDRVFVFKQFGLKTIEQQS